MKLLTFAHRGEAQAFLKAFHFSPVDFFFDGLLRSDDFFLLITGEGPHVASEKTVSVLSHFHKEITQVFNLGVAGSLNPNQKLHDLVWVRTSYAHHADKCEFKSYSSANSKAKNDCITAYSRVLNKEDKHKLSLFASIVDRELWAVASAAHLFKKNFKALKIISDEMTDLQIDICQFVKTEAPALSLKLLLEFNNEEQQASFPFIPKNPSLFLDDESFYFTLSQTRKLESLLLNLQLKGISIENLKNHSEILAIKAMDKLPKERTRLLLELLNEQLNPISLKIKTSIAKSIAPLVDAKISPSFDPDFEEDWLSLSMKIQSSRDLEKIKNALKIFSYEDFKKVFEGKFDV